MIVLHQANPTKQRHRKRVVIAPEKVIISGDVQNTKPNRLLTKKMNTWDDILVVLHLNKKQMIANDVMMCPQLKSMTKFGAVM